MSLRFEPTGEVRTPRVGEWYLAGMDLLVRTNTEHAKPEPIYRAVEHEPRVEVERLLVELLEYAMRNNWGPTEKDDRRMESALAAAKAVGMGGAE